MATWSVYLCFTPSIIITTMFTRDNFTPNKRNILHKNFASSRVFNREIKFTQNLFFFIIPSRHTTLHTTLEQRAYNVVLFWRRVPTGLLRKPKFSTEGFKKIFKCTAQKTPEYDPVFYRIGTDYFHIQGDPYKIIMSNWILCVVPT